MEKDLTAAEVSSFSSFKPYENAKKSNGTEFEMVEKAELKSNHKQKLRAQIRQDFALETSCHGLAQIYSSSNKKIKFLWIVLVLAVAGMLIWQVINQMSVYASCYLNCLKKKSEKKYHCASKLCNITLKQLFQ